MDVSTITYNSVIFKFRITCLQCWCQTWATNQANPSPSHPTPINYLKQFHKTLVLEVLPT